MTEDQQTYTPSLCRQEQQVSEAFSRQSVCFDDLYEGNPTTVWMRDRVRTEILSNVRRDQRMLELNCGTGIDTIFFAQKGYNITAIDNAPGMIAQLEDKLTRYHLKDIVTTYTCSFNDLSMLEGQQFDHIFSNFAGLNCTENLSEVLQQAHKLLASGGHFTFVIMPKYCPWELLSMVKGNYKLAFRRFDKTKANAHIEGVRFRCSYYSARYIIRRVPSGYKLKTLRGMCSIVPPPFMKEFPAARPRLYAALKRIELRLAHAFPFRTFCDQFIITMQKP